jgi:hypothetical protein
MSRFASPLALALLLRLTKEEHYETRFVVKAVLKKLIEATFQNTFPVELTRIIDRYEIFFDFYTTFSFKSLVRFAQVVIRF